MRMLLARHGNTFAPGDKVVCVGRETDLALVERGFEQARAVAAALKSRGLVPTRVFCGSLRRTRQYADVIVESLDLDSPAAVDPRLNEIDYGRWAGLTAREIADELGQKEQLERWNEADVWPADAGWISTQDEIHLNIRTFFADIRDSGGAHDRVLVVSSNGVLRLTPRLLGLTHPDGGRASTFHMKTGHLGVIECRDGAVSLKCWDVAPGDLVV